MRSTFASTVIAATLGSATLLLAACAGTPSPTSTYRHPRDRITIADQQTEGQARIPTWDGSTIRSYHFDGACHCHDTRQDG